MVPISTSVFLCWLKAVYPPMLTQVLVRLMMSFGRESDAMADAKRKKKMPLAVAAPLETLNFKVPPTFKKEFKGYAVSQGVTMIELLKEGFRLSKEARTQ